VAFGKQHIIDLGEDYGGNPCCPDVSEKDLKNWNTQNPDLLDSKDIRFEYTFLTKHFIIKLMPTVTYDSLQGFFMKSASGIVVEKVGISKAMDMMNVNSGASKFANKSS